MLRGGFMLDIVYIALFSAGAFLIALLIIRLCEKFWHSIKNYQSKVIIIPIGGHVEDMEIFIKSLANRLHSGNYDGIENIIIANMGADNETIDICKKLESLYDYVYFCEGREISEKLQENMFF